MAIFTTTINDNGTVSSTAPLGYAASYYVPYYDQLAKATQHHIAPESNTYEAFRPDPTSDSLLINRVLISALPSDPTLLQKAIADAVHLSTGIATGSARTLLPCVKISMLTTSIVIQVPPTDAPMIIKNGAQLSTASVQLGRCGPPLRPSSVPSAGALAILRPVA